MRPPYGAYNDLVRQAAASRNQTVTMWDHDTGDGSRAPVAQSVQGYTDLVARHPPTVLTLNHEVYGSFPSVTDDGEIMIVVPIAETTAREIVPHAIRVFQARGYRLVTVAECLGMEPYQSVTTPQNVRQSFFHVYIVAHTVRLRARGVAKPYSMSHGHCFSLPSRILRCLYQGFVSPTTDEYFLTSH